MKAYGELKMKLVEQFRTDIIGYMDGEHEFVQKIVKNVNKK